MVIYPDTSFLVSLYIDEGSSVQSRGFMARTRDTICFTPFHRLETRTALRLRAFRGDITLDLLKACLRRLEEDIADDIITHFPLNWSDALREAERIGEAFIVQTGSRSGDLLHVASALVLGATEFISLDLRQVELARRSGLKVKAWRSK
jgi:predicted nucleic acid-binding protein